MVGEILSLCLSVVLSISLFVPAALCINQVDGFYSANLKEKIVQEAADKYEQQQMRANRLPAYRSLDFGRFEQNGAEFMLRMVADTAVHAEEFSLRDLERNYDTAVVALDYNPIAIEQVKNLFDLEENLKWGDLYDSRSEKLYDFSDEPDITFHEKDGGSGRIFAGFPIHGSGLTVAEATNGDAWYIFTSKESGLKLIDVSVRDDADVYDSVTAICRKYGQPSGCFLKRVQEYSGISQSDAEYVLYWTRSSYVIAVRFSESQGSGKSWVSRPLGVYMYTPEAWKTISADIQTVDAEGFVGWDPIKLQQLSSLGGRLEAD